MRDVSDDDGYSEDGGESGCGDSGMVVRIGLNEYGDDCVGKGGNIFSIFNES